jgi:hypothetical protein
MGRAPCATWQPGKDEEGFFHSVVIRLNADFSPARDWSAAHAIVFPNFGESDWTTPLARHHYANVRYYSRPHVEPDLSGQTVWVRTACGPVADAAPRRDPVAAMRNARSHGRDRA